MGDLSTTPTTLRSATAEARVEVGEAGIALVREGTPAERDVEQAARVAGLLAAKQVPSWLPQRPAVTLLDTEITVELTDGAVALEALVQTVAPTGVEVEALAAATAAALAVHDLLAPHVDDLEVTGVRLVESRGGAAQFDRKVEGASAVVLVLSDTVAAGRKPDTAGRTVVAGLEGAGFAVAGYEVLPDEPEELAARLDEWLARRPDLVITVGGTGLGPRDRTVEVVRPLLTTEIPGLMEAARSFGQARTPYAMLSRGVAGLAGGSVVATFPGSRRGAEETLAAILPGLVHLIEVQRVVARHDGGYT